MGDFILPPDILPLPGNGFRRAWILSIGYGEGRRCRFATRLQPFSQTGHEGVVSHIQPGRQQSTVHRWTEQQHRGLIQGASPPGGARRPENVPGCHVWLADEPLP